MRATSVALLWPLLLLGGPAQAEMSVEQYTQKSGTSHMLDTVWLYGVQNGFAWANAYNGDRGLPPLYCQPENLALTRDQVTNILDNFIKTDQGRALLNAEISLVLLKALQHAFPCPH
ncbi:MAG: hypothetical protein ABSG18_16440 [Steroidobacteraceae bacterium]